ncbi:MAG: TraR/DksA C4-type zinc finger protein [Bacteroidia bacterium]
MENKSKIRYSDAELAEFKELIDGKLAEAEKSYAELKESLEAARDQSSHASAWDVEDSTDFNEREYLLAMMNRQRKYIQNLQSALVRIANKTYGICRITGKLIDKERLRIVPHTTLSIEAKQGKASDDGGSD